MKNFAEELQTTIDEYNAWAAKNFVEKAVDIFVQDVKEDMMSQAKRGIQIDDMGIVVGGYDFDKICSAFYQVRRKDVYPTEKQIKKFKSLLCERMMQEGLKFEFRKSERTELITMVFTVYSNDI